MESCRLDERKQCARDYQGKEYFQNPARNLSWIKLEDYRQKQEELELRAVSAEMEATHLNLEANGLHARIAEYKETIETLKKQLDSLREINSTGEKNMTRFHRKLSRIRSAMTKEVDKMKRNEGDLQLALDSLRRCILEYRTNVISKSDFLLAVDVINSTLNHQASSSTQIYSNCNPSALPIPVFGNTETEKLALLSPLTRKSCLQSLMNMLSEQGMNAPTDDELLDRDEDEQQTPPPIPPRQKSMANKEGSQTSILSYTNQRSESQTSYIDMNVQRSDEKPSILSMDGQMSESQTSISNPTEEPHTYPPNNTILSHLYKLSDSSSDHFISLSGILMNPKCDSTGNGTTPKQPQSPRKQGHSGTKQRTRSSSSKELGQYSMAGGVDYDTDSSDDFVQFIPPMRRSRYISEPAIHDPILLRQKDRSAMSPDKNSTIKKSSPILTKRPVWYHHKSTSSVPLSTLYQTPRNKNEDRKFKVRSRSLDDKTNMSVTSPNQSGSRSPDIQAQVSGYTLAGVCCDSDDNTGGSKDYSKPFEHILWKRLGLDDGNTLSGSLPLLNQVTTPSEEVIGEEEEEEDPYGCTYLDPKELEGYCENIEEKQVQDRNQRRLGTVLSSTYLTLSSVQSITSKSNTHENKPDVHVEPCAVASSLPTSIMHTPKSKNPSLNVLGNVERWKRNIEAADSSCYSGYSTDASSGWGDFEDDFVEGQKRKGENSYDTVSDSLLQALESTKLDLEKTVVVAGENTEEIYAEISDYKTTDFLSDLPALGTNRGLQFLPHRSVGHTSVHPSASVPLGSDERSRYISSATARSNVNVKRIPQSNHESLYAALKDIPARQMQSPPTLPPRPTKKGSVDPKQSLTRNKNLNIPGIGPLPLYTTIKNDGRRMQLIPLSNESPNQSQDEHVLSEHEPNDHLYSLGRFISTTNSGSRFLIPENNTGSQSISDSSSPVPNCSSSSTTMPLPPRRQTLSAEIPRVSPSILSEQGSGSGSDPLLESFMEAQDISPTTLPPRSNTLPIIKESLEKSGFLRKMDLKLKNWNRRWFVLKGSELKYYKPNRKTLKGIINLDSWCKLTKTSSPDTFCLATSKKTYHLVCKSEQECNEWLKAIEAAMQMHKCQERTRSPLKKKGASVSGWAHVNQNGQCQRVWCALNEDNLDMCVDPKSEPIRRISVAQSVVRKKRDSILLDSSSSHSNLKSVLFTIQDSTGMTEIHPETQEDKESWYYHLSATQSGGQDLMLTKMEKLISEIMQEEKGNPSTEDHRWKHPILNHTTGPLQHALTSLPSSSLNDRAKRLFQSVQLFLTTTLTLNDLSYHICSAQHIIGTCLKHLPLQDELYCQVIRQISGHAALTNQVIQGWLLLSLMITSFLPIKPKFLWYLSKFINRHLNSSSPILAGFARFCQQAIATSQEQGQRQCKPSSIELVYILSKFAESQTKLDFTLVVPVYLSDGTNIDVEFTPFTFIRNLASTINKQIGLPDTNQTGFAIMCDWPGVDDATCCCPFPNSKVVDVMSTWSSALEELNDQILMDHDTVKTVKNQRSILITYKRRVFVQSHIGSETDKEAILLAYQISKSVHTGEYPVTSQDTALLMAAMLTQMEHGDWEQGATSEEITQEAVLRFCPWRLTHLALDHDMSFLQRKLAENWKKFVGQSKEECARKYIAIAQEWSHYGSTAFQAEEYASDCNPRRAIWLTVSEKGVSLLERASMRVLSSYSYSEISTFGGNGDHYFMLVVISKNSPTTGQRTPQWQQQQQQQQQLLTGHGNIVEKLMFAMPKHKICEATFLIASYIELDTQNKK